MEGVGATLSPGVSVTAEYLNTQQESRTGTLLNDWTDEPFSRYAVVVNDEEQYSIWPTVKDVPRGWRPVGVEGSKADCLSHIERVWTDIRPLSVRVRSDVPKMSEPPRD